VCRTMPVGAHSIDIPQEVAVGDPIVQLGLGVCIFPGGQLKVLVREREIG